jgi:hypothetical protein
MALRKKAWPVPSALALVTYLAGLTLVVLGERVFATRPHWEYSLLAIAGIFLAISVLTRFLLHRSDSTEKARVEYWMGWLTLGTIAAVVFAVLIQHQPSWFGIRPELPTDLRDRRTGVLNVVWVASLLFTIVPLVFSEAALYPMRTAAQPEMRRIRSAVLAGLTLALVALYGSLFVYSAGKVGVAADYSYFKTAKPSQSTRRIARGLKDSIRVVALFPSVSETRREVERYLADLSRGIPKLHVEFHDRLLEPKVARELRASQDGSIILSRGEVRQIVNVGVEQKNARTVLRNLDQEFQKNLLKLSRDAKLAYFTIGHGELNERKGSEANSNGQGVQILKKLLETQNFRIQDLGPSQGLGREVPQDADVVLVLGPTEPLAPEELATLDAYARRGGHLLLALDVDARGVEARPGSPSTVSSGQESKTLPHSQDNAAKIEAAVNGVAAAGIGANLEEIARMVGLSVEPGVLANDRIFVQRHLNKSDYTQLVSNRFSSHAAVSTLNRNSASVVFFGAGSLKKLDQNDNTVSFITHSMPGTYIDRNGDFDLNGAESRGNYELVAAIARPVAGAGNKQVPKGVGQDKNDKDTRAIVIGDADVASDLVLMNSPANRVLLMDAVRWLVGEESFAGEISTEEDVRIQHTKERDVFWFYSTILGAPILVLGLGLFVVRRSRTTGGRA